MRKKKSLFFFLAYPKRSAFSKAKGTNKWAQYKIKSQLFLFLLSNGSAFVFRKQLDIFKETTLTTMTTFSLSQRTRAMLASALAWRVPSSARLNSAENRQCVKKTKAESQLFYHAAQRLPMCLAVREHWQRVVPVVIVVLFYIHLGCFPLLPKVEEATRGSHPVLSPWGGRLLLVFVAPQVRLVGKMPLAASYGLWPSLRKQSLIASLPLAWRDQPLLCVKQSKSGDCMSSIEDDTSVKKSFFSRKILHCLH